MSHKTIKRLCLVGIIITVLGASTYGTYDTFFKTEAKIAHKVELRKDGIAVTSTGKIVYKGDRVTTKSIAHVVSHDFLIDSVKRMHEETISKEIDLYFRSIEQEEVVDYAGVPTE